jgi:hypothetical protein
MEPIVIFIARASAAMVSSMANLPRRLGIRAIPADLQSAIDFEVKDSKFLLGESQQISCIESICSSKRLYKDISVRGGKLRKR